MLKKHHPVTGLADARSLRVVSGAYLFLRTGAEQPGNMLKTGRVVRSGA